jgi:DNA processing protein
MTSITTSSSIQLPSLAVTDEDTAARVALAGAGVAGDVAVCIGIRMFGSATRFVAAVHDQCDAAVPLSPLVRHHIRTWATGSRVAKILERTTRLGLALLTPLRAGWPTQLESMRGAAPLVLWVRGEADSLKAPSIAVTGASNPSAYDIHMAIELATGLAARGWVLVTGASGGLDEVVLRSAEAMKSPTVTVMSSSLPEHALIPEHAVQVSEVPPGIRSTIGAQRRAKQLMAALASRSIVDESSASARGSLLVKTARSLNRPVGVMPAEQSRLFGSASEDIGLKTDVQVIRSVRDADSFH